MIKNELKNNLKNFALYGEYSKGYLYICRNI